MKNPYEILGVSNSANEEEIKQAYRKIAMKNHPDRNPGDAEAEKRFKEATDAYERLTGQSQPQQNFNFDDAFGDMFSQIFNFGGQRQQLNLDIHLEVALDFWEAVDGCEKTLTVPKSDECDTCKGTGSAETKTCLYCAGQGQRVQRQGNMTISTACPQCGGKGKQSLKDCGSCSGRGSKHSTTSVKVTFPAGTQDHMTLRMPGAGNQSGRHTGSLFVSVRVNGHEHFRRQEDDLVYTFPVQYSVLVKGGTVVIPTLSESIEMDIRPLTKSGTRMRIGGQGFMNPQSGRRGNIVVEVVADTVNPDDVELEYKNLVEALYEWEKENVTPNMKLFHEKCKR